MDIMQHLPSVYVVTTSECPLSPAISVHYHQSSSVNTGQDCSTKVWLHFCLLFTCLTLVSCNNIQDELSLCIQSYCGMFYPLMALFSLFVHTHLGDRVSRKCIVQSVYFYMLTRSYNIESLSLLSSETIVPTELL